MDAWTNVFADPGIRTLGNNGATYAIVGPNWHGQLPTGLQVIHAPTQMVWVMARVYVRNQADLPAAQACQRQLDIRPLSRLNDASFQQAYTATGGQSPEMMGILKGMTPKAFFERFLSLTAANTPTPQDAPFIKDDLEPLGLTPGQSKAWASISYLDRIALTLGFNQVLDHFSSQVAGKQNLRQKRNQSALVNGWGGVPGVNKTPHGTFGTDYLDRARVAVGGLAATLRADAIHLHKNRLVGSQAYRLTFPAGNTPPVQGFWSVTLYNDKGYLVANALNRYAIRSGEDLVYQPDGSLVLYLQPNDPGPGQRSNWLPTPPGQTYELTLRAYWPKEELLDGKWTPPAVVPVR